jgi:hypothetical protein
VAVNTELTKAARLWYLTGNDPYEVTMQNPAYSNTAVLAGREPNSSAAYDTAPNDKYPLVQMAEPDDATYKLNTFMVLKYMSLSTPSYMRMNWRTPADWSKHLPMSVLTLL